MSTKLCYSCKQELSKDQFGKDSTRGDGLKFICKTCFSTWRRSQMTMKYQNAVDLKGGKCEDCGKVPKEYGVGGFHFHHLDPKEKEVEISTEISKNKKWETIKEELDKCVLLCDECHRKRHSDFRKGLRPTL